jgi:plastocyanin
MNSFARAFLVTALVSAAAVLPASADDEYKLTMSDSGFEPATLTIPAGKKITLSVTNASKKAAEFESSDISREKVIPAGKTVTISVGPLKAGTYEFEDDFNKAHKGKLTVK